MPSSNLPASQKTNWVPNEYVMPVDTNGWGTAINTLSKAVPIYASTGCFYTISSRSGNALQLIPLVLSDNTQNQTPNSYIDGMNVWFLSNFNSTGSVTVNVNGLGTKTVYQLNNTTLTSGKIKNGYFIHLIYNATNDRFYFINVEGLPEFNGHANEFLGTDGNSALWKAFVSKTISLSGAVTGSATMNTGTSDTVSISTTGKTKTIQLSGAVTGSATFNTGNTDTVNINTTASVNVLEILQQMYPIGAIFLGTTQTCPMSALFGTWSLVSSGKALWTGDGTNANTTISAGIPDLQGWFSGAGQGSGYCDGVLFSRRGSGAKVGNPSSAEKDNAYDFKASDYNSVYGGSSTVQPPAYVVNVWRRTA